MSLQWMSLDEERRMEREYHEKLLAWRADYRPLDFDSDQEMPHERKPNVLASAFVIGLLIYVPLLVWYLRTR